jgi:hypothetical protein
MIDKFDAPADSVPQAGEQLLPPAVRVQFAPELDGSFVTEAFKVMGAAPIKMEENGLSIVMLAGGKMVKVNANTWLFSATEIAAIVAC